MDPRRGDHSVESVKVNGKCAESVDTFKYPGLLLDTKLLSSRSVKLKRRVSGDCTSFGDCDHFTLTKTFF